MPKITSLGRTVTIPDARDAELVYKALADLGFVAFLHPDVPKIDNFLINSADMQLFELARATNSKVSCIKYVRCRTGAGLLEAKLWCDHWIFNDDNFCNVRFGS